jgi:hypothetical protein
MNCIQESFRDIAAKLRYFAERMEYACKEALLAPQNETISGAMTKLKAAGGVKDPNITLSVSHYDHSEEVTVEWKVWDGAVSHRGQTLDAALVACLASHAPQQSIKDTQRLVDAAVANPLPF